jgi:hypothetical protein
MEPQQLPLRDIHLPEAIGWWPPAIGWWILAALIPLLFWFIVWLYKRITRKTAVKTAKKLLLALQQDTSLSDKDKLGELSALMRRVAISQSPRAETASLTGQAWLKFLDKSVQGAPFTQGAGKVLADAHYQKSITAVDIVPVIKLCETWLKAQK